MPTARRKVKSAGDLSGRCIKLPLDVEGAGLGGYGGAKLASTKPQLSFTLPSGRTQMSSLDGGSGSAMGRPRLGVRLA